MNKVILMGRLTRDPEVRYTASNQQMAVSRYTLAVDRSYKREGEPDADFVNIVTFLSAKNVLNFAFLALYRLLVLIIFIRQSRSYVGCYRQPHAGSCF